jgi:protein-tyrosine phosphatase
MAAGLAWRAASRGLAVEWGVNNVGPMSRATAARLRALGIPHESYVRMPQSVTEADFAAAHMVIALKEAEHRPLMAKRFPHLVDRIEYWAVHDLDAATPEQALAEIEEQVRALIARLQN